MNINTADPFVQGVIVAAVAAAGTGLVTGTIALWGSVEAANRNARAAVQAAIENANAIREAAHKDDARKTSDAKRERISSACQAAMEAASRTMSDLNYLATGSFGPKAPKDRLLEIMNRIVSDGTHYYALLRLQPETTALGERYTHLTNALIELCQRTESAERLPLPDIGTAFTGLGTELGNFVGSVQAMLRQYD